MKKLLILGGSRFIVPVIRAAQQMNIYVITCDYLPNNHAHKYSDEYWNLSIIDKELVLEAAKEKEIDGVMSFACDPGVVTAAYIAQSMNLPNVGPLESVNILQNKSRFRNFLLENNFNVPSAKGYSDSKEVMKDIDLFKWPVIVKPADSAGSKGVSKIFHIDELYKSSEYALSYSLSKEFIVEDYIVQDGFSSDSDAFLYDGKLIFMSFNAQRFDDKAINPYVPAAYSWPSSLSENAQMELKEEVERLLKLLKMNTGIFNIETRVGKDGKPYIMEVSPRGGGNRLSECIQHISKTDLISNMVRYSVGMPIVENDIYEHIIQESWAEIILHSNNEGKFIDLWISDNIKSNIIEKDLWINKGDFVKEFNAANEAIGTLILKFDSRKQMDDFFLLQEQYVKILVEELL